MNGRGRLLILRRGVAVWAIAVAVIGFGQTRASATQQVNLTLTYTCTFPVIGDHSTPVQIESNIPDSIAVGQSTAHYVVNASATAPGALAFGLHTLFGVSTITGTVDGQVSVRSPQGDQSETVPFDIHPINLPYFSSFTGTATGSAPEVTFDKPGEAEIVVGDLIMHLIPRDSNGNLTSLGEPTVPCKLDPGQKNTVSFTITGTPSPTQSNSVAADAAPTPTPTPRASSPSPGTHPSTSTSATTGLVVPPSVATPTQSASATDSARSTGASAAWVIWFGGLAALIGLGVAAFRYGPRLWRR